MPPFPEHMTCIEAGRRMTFLYDPDTGVAVRTPTSMAPFTPEVGKSYPTEGLYLTPVAGRSAGGDGSKRRQSVWSPSRRRTTNIAVLAHAALIGPVPVGSCVDHIDGNPENDSINNLRILSAADNSRHRSTADLERRAAESGYPGDIYIRHTGGRRVFLGRGYTPAETFVAWYAARQARRADPADPERYRHWVEKAYSELSGSQFMAAATRGLLAVRRAAQRWAQRRVDL
jgi:hypothetical protein